MNVTPAPSKALQIVSWIARVVAAVILLQTLYFKFSGAPESVYIFTAVGQEPWGRFGSGVVELIASVLLFVPRGVAIGALLAARYDVRGDLLSPHQTRDRRTGRRWPAL